MVTEAQAREIFLETQVLQEGHFRLTSGRHSDKYMQCARVFQYANHAETLCKALAEQFDGIDVVVGPAIGAISMAYEVSRHLNVRNLFAERVEGSFALRRGFSLQPGERVLVVEDTVTTGGSVREVIELVNSLGATVAGVGCLVDRSNGKTDFGVPFKSVVSMEVISWEAEECPLCKQGLPIIKPGSRPSAT